MLNNFAVETEKCHLRSWIRPDLSKGEAGDKVAEGFNKNGVLSLLEAENYDEKDLISPFFGEIDDVSCGAYRDAPVTDGIKKCVGLVQYIKKRSIYSG